MSCAFEFGRSLIFNCIFSKQLKISLNLLANQTKLRSILLKNTFISLFLLILTGIFISGKSEDEIGKKYSGDFNALVVSLKELHPLLYANVSKEEFDKNAENISQRLFHVTSNYKAIYLIQEFVFKIGNAHAGNLSVFSIYNDTSITRVLPFSVYILDHQLYIKDYPADSTYNGTKIYSIENTDSKVLIDSLKIFFPIDGKRDIIDFNLQLYFNALYGAYCCQKDFFAVSTEKGKMNFKAAVRGTPLFETLIFKNKDTYLGKERILKKEITKDYGYFKFAGFIPKYKDYNIEADFNSMIRELNKNKTPNLIIDLKYNEGGNPEMGARMISLLTEKPFRIFENIYEIKCRKPTYKKLMNGSSLYYKTRGLRTRKAGNLRQVVRMERDLKVIHHNKEIYKGNIYIITGSATKSASTMFCKYLIGQSNVKFVGSETSGAINYFWAGGPNGSFCELRLPSMNTVFAFAIDLNEIKAGSSKNEVPIGLVPYYKIEYTIEDLMSGKNKELEWIKDDILKSTKN
jgi:hypothetical protein